MTNLTNNEQIDPIYSSDKTKHMLGFAILTFSLALFPSASSWAKENSNVCTNITKSAFKACKHDVQDDFWINVGNCINTDDKHEDKECRREARVQRREERELCRAQKYARNDICDALGHTAYQPKIDPSDFLSAEEIAANPNPYFPLTPGLVKTFTSSDETVVVTVTSETVEILGVTCIVVRDIVTEDGEVVEDTDDWFAQDIEGNVWYFGEISKNYEDGELNNLDGSWKAGEEGALPGIIMKATPVIGDIYRQEFALGEAEDMAEVLSLTETSESTPAADCSDSCLVTHEFLPIEPDADELKYYVPGIGIILAIDQTNGDREELVDIVMP